jgi:hypothetical protein
MSFNKWNYVDGNLINRTDPSGYCYLEGDPEECNYQSLGVPNTVGYNEKVSPVNITWYPQVDPYPNGSIGIPRNINGAQLIDGDIGLCGLVALSAITGISVQTIRQLYITLANAGFIRHGTDSPPNYQGPGTLNSIVNNGIEGGWMSKNGLYWTDFVLEPNGGIIAYPNNVNYQANLLYQLLSESKHPIAGVEIEYGDQWNEASGKVQATSRPKDHKITHWVVISGVSTQWSKTNGFLNNDKVHKPGPQIEQLIVSPSISTSL